MPPPRRGTAKNKENNCATCSKNVSEKDLALGCEVCDKWFHISCQSITEDEYEFLIEHKNLHWYCSSCNSNVAGLVQIMSDMRGRHQKLEEKIDSLVEKVDAVAKDLKETDKKVDEMTKGLFPEAMIKSVDGQIDRFVKKIKTEFGALSLEVESLKTKSNENETKLETAIEAKLVEGISKSSFVEVLSQQIDTKYASVTEGMTQVKQVLEDTKKLAEEEKDKETRSNNVILYRVTECVNREERNKQDKLFCVQLFKDYLGVDVEETDFKSVFRIGKFQQDSVSPRPILV